MKLSDDYAVNGVPPDEMLKLFNQLLRDLGYEVRVRETIEIDGRNLTYSSYTYRLAKLPTYKDPYE